MSTSLDNPTTSTGASHGAPVHDETISRTLVGSIVATAILSFLGLFLETVLNVLFPALMGAFGIGTSAVSWMTSGYLLVVSVMMPLSGWLQRRFSNRNLFAVAALTVIVGAVVAALAPTYGMLLGGRLLQGVGTAIATPLMFTIIVMRAPRAKVGMLMGMGALVLGTAPALGPTLGGVIGTVASWRVVFWLVVPLALVSLALGWRCLDTHTPDVRPILVKHQVLLLAITFAGLLLGVERIGALVATQDARSAGAVALAVALPVSGLAALGILLFSLRRSTSPLIHLSVVRQGAYTWSLVAFSIMQFSALGLGYLLPNHAQLGLGHTSMAAGLLVLPGTVLGALFAPLGGMLLDRIGARLPILTGTCVALLGVVLLGLFGHHAGLFLLGLGYFVYMFGFGLSYANTQTYGMHHVEHHLSPDATALMNTCQQFTGALAMTVLSTIVAVAQGSERTGSAAYRAATTRGVVTGFWVVAALVAVALFAQWRAHSTKA